MVDGDEMTSSGEMTSCCYDHKLVIYSSNICFEKGKWKIRERKIMKILISLIIFRSFFRIIGWADRGEKEKKWDEMKWLIEE